MKKIILLFFALVVSLNITAQWGDNGASKNIKWTFDSNQTGDNEFELLFKAEISSGYHMYSMDKTDGPLPLEFKFAPANCELVGNMSSDKETKEKFDEGFAVNVKYYEGTVSFKQKVKLLSGQVNLTGTVSYQICSEEQCIPGESDFSFNLKPSAKTTAGTTATTAAKTTAEPSAPNTPAASETKTSNRVTPANSAGTLGVINASNETTTVAETAAVGAEEKSLSGFLILALFMGLLGVITPCVFPMIPMTVSFFMSGSDKRTVIVTKGIIFGLSVTLIYTIVGVIVALTQNDAFANILSTHWIPNLLFFILFIAFALSFFGVFEITLPSSLANKADKQVDKGGYLASFFLAVTLAIVSFSCTGPFVGTLLVESARGGVALKPIFGMFGFGLGLGLPFIVFAFIPSLMKKLPKSGGWLNSVKVVFAFILLALSLKFLDITDNYFRLNLITRDAVIAVWIVIATFTGLYLLGKITLAHDSNTPHVSVFRLFLSIASFSFALYLLPGLFGAPLSAVSAFLPAQEKQVFSLTSDAPQYIFQQDAARNATPDATASAANNLCGVPKYSDFLTLPKGISGYFDLQEGLACAKEQNKPVLLDFKGHNCSNCKKMEKGIFLDRRIIDILNEKFIVIGLYTDDKTELPESEHVTAANGKVLKTIGAVNLNYEASTYNLNAQPYFVITDSNGKALTNGTGYETNADKFLQWLEKGLNEL
jgi:thiol:disulfide interchange protein DsbD